MATLLKQCQGFWRRATAVIVAAPEPDDPGSNDASMEGDDTDGSRARMYIASLKMSKF
jgi:hypothetical protein